MMELFPRNSVQAKRNVRRITEEQQVFWKTLSCCCCEDLPFISRNYHFKTLVVKSVLFSSEVSLERWFFFLPTRLSIVFQICYYFVHAQIYLGSFFFFLQLKVAWLTSPRKLCIAVHYDDDFHYASLSRPCFSRILFLILQLCKEFYCSYCRLEFFWTEHEIKKNISM